MSSRSKTTPEQLQALLACHDQSDLARRCLAALNHDALTNASTLFVPSPVELPIQRTREVYKARAEMNSSKGRMVGYDELIPRLQAARSAVSIHTVATEEEYFVVFTDPKITELLGILWCQSDHVFRYFKRNTDAIWNP